MTGTLETIDGRPGLRFERRLNHPVERVWRAVTEPAELARWFVAPVAWTPELGETFEAMGTAGEIVELDPPHRISWTHGTQRFGFELSRLDGGCLLVFTHVFDDGRLAAQHAAGWEIYLNRLDALLAGGFLTEEEAHASFPALLESYRAGFESGPVES